MMTNVMEPVIYQIGENQREKKGEAIYLPNNSKDINK